MELSKRLQAVANLVTAGYRTADIGTDHAYIPIYLVENGLVPSAIAMDINAGPLERARVHVEEKELLRQIELRLSDGLCALAPGETDSAVLAGMGGGLVMKILKDNWNVTLSLKECILQPQSEIAKVRAFLLEEGFLFIQEDMVLEEGKFYPMMKVVPSHTDRTSKQIDGNRADEDEAAVRKQQSRWSETEIRYGRLLLQAGNPVLKRFLEKEIALKTEIMDNLKGQNSSHAKQRMEELELDLRYAKKGMEYYAL